MKRKLGIVAEFVHNVPATENLELIKEAGFEAYFTGRYREKDVFELKNKGDKLGLSCDFLHAPFAGVNAMWQNGMDYLTVFQNIKTAIDAAAENGVPAVVVHLSSGWTPPEICDLGLSRYDALVEHAIKRNVTVAFENLRRLGNLAYMLDRYEKIPQVGFCYDNGHEHCFTEDLPFLELFGKRTVCTHLHDNTGIRKDDPTIKNDNHFLPFDGDFDFPKMMKRLNACGYEGTLMLETWIKDHYVGMDPKDYITTAYERIKKIAEM